VTILFSLEGVLGRFVGRFLGRQVGFGLGFGRAALGIRVGLAGFAFGGRLLTVFAHNGVAHALADEEFGRFIGQVLGRNDFREALVHELFVFVAGGDSVLGLRHGFRV